MNAHSSSTNPIFLICRLQRCDITTKRPFPARLTGICDMFADRPRHLSSRFRVFPSSGDSCPAFEFTLLSIPVFHKLKAGALAHALPRRWILASIDRNSFSGTATSAIWKTPIKEKVKTTPPLKPPCGGSPSCMSRFGGRPVCPTSIGGLTSVSCGPFKTFVRRLWSSRRDTYLRLASPCLIKSRRLWFHRGLLGLGAYPRTDPHAQRTCGICLC
jgi:hypothetical protein